LELKSAGMKESVYSIAEIGLDPWKEAALEYKSQLVGLGEIFDTPEKVQVSIQSYWEKCRGIRLLQMQVKP